MLNVRMKALRKERNKTQQDIANILGVSRPAYTAYEQGNRTPDNEAVETLADYYDVTIDYLFGRTDQKNASKEYEIQTIAAHHDGDEWTEEELEEIERFKEFVRMKRGNKQE